MTMLLFGNGTTGSGTRITPSISAVRLTYEETVHHGSHAERFTLIHNPFPNTAVQDNHIPYYLVFHLFFRTFQTA